MAYTLSPTEPIPVVLITGALGSGKTSLLSAILGKRTLRNSVVLINEFGAMGLDGDCISSHRRLWQVRFAQVTISPSAWISWSVGIL